MRAPRLTALSLVALLLGATAAPAAPIGSIIETRGNGTIQIDERGGATWTFVSEQAWYLDGVSFRMKAGPKTEAPLILSIFEGKEVTGKALATLVLDEDDFEKAHGGNTQKWAPVLFRFEKEDRVWLDAGAAYTLALGSKAPNEQSAAYFVSGIEELVLPAAAFSQTERVQGGDVSVPEPASLVLLGAMALGVAGIRLRSRA